MWRAVLISCARAAWNGEDSAKGASRLKPPLETYHKTKEVGAHSLVHVGALLQQQLQHRLMTFFRRDVQGSRIILRRGTDSTGLSGQSLSNGPQRQLYQCMRTLFLASMLAPFSSSSSTTAP